MTIDAERTPHIKVLRDEMASLNERITQLNLALKEAYDKIDALTTRMRQLTARREDVRNELLGLGDVVVGEIGDIIV